MSKIKNTFKELKEELNVIPEYITDKFPPDFLHKWEKIEE